MRARKSQESLSRKNTTNPFQAVSLAFTKVTSLKILTHLITEYTELEDEDVHDINRKMKEPISGETLFEDFVEQIEWNQ